MTRRSSRGMIVAAVVSDMASGLKSQVRRGAGAVTLIVLALSVASGALLVAFALARTTLSDMLTRLPGEISSLYYMQSSVTSSAISDVWVEVPNFTTDQLSQALRQGLVEGYFFEITSRPVLVGDREFRVTLCVYDGRVPLYGNTAANGLERAAESRGVAVNKALVDEFSDAGPGRWINFGPGGTHPVVEVVGPPARVVGVPSVFVPASLATTAARSSIVGVYLHQGQDPRKVAGYLQDYFRQASPRAAVTAIPGTEALGSGLREARMVAALAVAGGLLISLVAFVNVATLGSLWVLRRTRGLAIRRALGATSRLVAWYVVFDLVALTLTALGVGLVMGFLILRSWDFPIGFIDFVPPTAITVAASVALGLLINRFISRPDPGQLMGRSL